MARPKKVEEVTGSEIVAQDLMPLKAAVAAQSNAVAKEIFVDAPKPSVKVAHFHAGLDLIASRTSADHKSCDIYELDHGLLLVTKKVGKTGGRRKVVIPYANIRGYELL